jgi:hypothetical protein
MYRSQELKWHNWHLDLLLTPEFFLSLHPVYTQTNKKIQNVKLMVLGLPFQRWHCVMADKQVAMSLSSQLILHSTDVDY